MLQGVLLTLLCSALCRASIDNQKPNIIFILADDLGWNDVSFHGSRQIPTPNLDALAYDGILLSNYYVQPICTPTRSALMTGRYPIHTGMQHSVIVSAEPYGLGLNETLLPQYLKELNYSTHIVGKWHLGYFDKAYTPMNRGFDSHYGYYQGCGDYYDHTYTNYAPKAWGLDFRKDKDVLKTAFGQYSTELFSGEAEKIIGNHDKNQPLFMYLPHQAVHSGNPGTPTPLEAPWKYQEKFSHIKHNGRRMFAAMVSALDDAVGNVTKALNARGMLENSIIVFSTDNGGPAGGFDFNFANNWPLRGLKSTLWEGGTRASGFIWSPLTQKYGYTAQQLVHVTDWLPTLLHAAGYDEHKLPSDLDGFDLWDVLSTNDTSTRTQILYNIDPKGDSGALRYNTMKIIYGKDSTARYDGWYKPEQMTRKSLEEFNKELLDGETKEEGDVYERYNSEMVDNDEALKSPITTSTEEEDEEAPAHMFRSDLTPILRSIGRGNNKGQPDIVLCKNPPANYSTSCKPAKRPCLFDIATDPCEFNNIADKYPTVADHLMTLLNNYKKTMVAPRNKPSDKKGLPVYHNGIWEPWINLEEEEEIKKSNNGV